MARIPARLVAALALIAVGCDVASDGRPIGPHLRVVGTVQDGGLPHAACSCERCESARRDPARARHIASLALIPAGGRGTLLVDATPDIRAQLDAVRESSGPSAGAVNRSPLDGILLTHAHLGHYTGLAFFGFEAVHTRNLPVYCSPRMARFLTDNGPWSQLVRLGNIELRETPAGETFTVGGGVEVTPIAVPHRDEYSDTLGFLFRGPRAGVLYVPDTDRWDTWQPPLLERLEQVDVAILDGTFYSGDELPGRPVASIPHPLIVDSMDLLEPLVRSGRLRVLFTHLNHSNPALDPSSPERARMRERGFEVLEEGAVLPL